MLYTNLKILVKQLLRNKTYTTITILGFSISLMFVILLSMYIQQELSVDNFHLKKDRIYRLTTGESSSFAPPIGQRLKDKYPEIESFTRLHHGDEILTDSKKQKYQFNYLLADSSFFTMFSFSFVEGDPKEVFKVKNSIVLSKSLATKVFGSVSPVGQEVNVDQHRFVVTGVIEDFTENTHITKCDALIPFEKLAEFWNYPELLTNYDNCSFALYFLIKTNADIKSKEQEILEDFKKDFWLYKWGNAKKVEFEPLKEIYFGQKDGHGARGNSMKVIIIFSTIAIVILLLAIINYINLSVAQSSLRSREVAVKKLHGSTKGRLFLQFIIESIVICIVAFNIALIFTKFAEPIFNELFNTNLNLTQRLNFTTLIVYLIGIAMVGVISGLIPAFVITRFNAIEIVKGAFRRKSKSVFSRVLISFQYCTAIILIICTWVIVKQTNFMKTYDLGFKKDNIVFIGNDIKNDQRDAFKNEVLKIAGIVDVAYAAGSPIDGGNNNTIQIDGKTFSFQVFKVDSSFINMFDLKITQTGGALSKLKFCLNQAAVKALGCDSLPKTFKFPNGNEVPVYGIVKDFHFRDLYQKVGPAMIMDLPKKDGAWSIFIKISGLNKKKTIEEITKVHSQFTSGNPMDFEFVDEQINSWYKKEEQTAKIIGYFSLLAIVISVMGILAMATFYIGQRVKEIGIRKVNGATEIGIVGLLNSDLIKWVVLAFIVACPIAYYASTKWLENFPFKTTVDWWIYLASGFIAIFFALITVSWQSWRAAGRNPVEALRYE
ncbi:MAG TPA: hypothetical protein DIW31_02450 [Bacteroidales bacterium]|nr:hypothetical protein [Bacteroidales bacterium]